MTWILRLNDMRFPQIEITAPVAQAETREELVALVERERVPSYTDEGDGPYGPTRWGKQFRKGGPLEWFNPPDLTGGVFDVGTEADSIEAVLRDRRRALSEYPPVGSLTGSTDP